MGLKCLRAVVKMRGAGSGLMSTLLLIHLGIVLAAPAVDGKRNDC